MDSRDRRGIFQDFSLLFSLLEGDLEPFGSRSRGEKPELGEGFGEVHLLILLSFSHQLTKREGLEGEAGVEKGSLVDAILA